MNAPGEFIKSTKMESNMIDKFLKTGVLVGLFSLVFFSSKEAFAQQMSLSEKYGACAGYHQFWSVLSMRSGRYNDQRFSDSVVSRIDASYGSSADYNKAKLTFLQILNKALQDNNPNMVRSTAGFCAELNLPLGKNTK